MDTPWIPDECNFKVFTPRSPSAYYPMRVADLIDPITCKWNKQFIEETFWPVDCERILSIPIGAITSDDRLVWHFSKDGKYSVKTAYQVLLAARCSQVHSSGGAASGEATINWNEVWNLNLPPKIRMVLWRVCRNILPHAVELTRRRVSSNPFCSHCKSELETTAHVLMVCRGLNQIWEGPPFGLPEVETHISPWALLQMFKHKLANEDFLVAMVVWWKAWEMRNKEVFGEEIVQQDILGWAKKYLEGYLELQVKPPPADSIPLPAIWIPPDPGYIKVNVDVAYPEKAEFIRVAMVARDHRGVTLWWARSEIVGRPKPTEGEAMAVVFGVHRALQQRWKNVIIETDCLPVHRYLTRGSSSLISFGAILDDCFISMSRFDSLLFSFIKRSGTCYAHAIATAKHLLGDEGAFFPSHLME